MSRRIVVTGGTGFIGQPLCRRLVRDGYDVVVLSRSGEKPKSLTDPGITVAQWDGKTADGWAAHADGAYGLINLAGENIGGGYWTTSKKVRILSSRLDAGRAVRDAVDRAENKPSVLIQASAVGYYGLQDENLLDESAPRGMGFLADVCRQWEQSTADVEHYGVRRVILRTGVVLGRKGGALPQMCRPFRFFLGGPIGSGRQWMPWIHIDDLIGAIMFLIERDDLKGVFNGVAPDLVRGKDFFRMLGRSLNRPSWLRVPASILKLVLGDMAEELFLKGQRVIPKRLLGSGYAFRHPDLGPALEEILSGSADE
jgi:hypothetical protein